MTIAPIFMSIPFFFHYPATTEIYTLSLHDALPISDVEGAEAGGVVPTRRRRIEVVVARDHVVEVLGRGPEGLSEHLVENWRGEAEPVVVCSFHARPDADGQR